MSSVRRAVIDVGTNSIKVLVADITGHEVVPVLEESKQTRLGSGFYQAHRLQAEPIAKTAVAVARFAHLARELRAESVRLIATSAARDAVNAGELIAALEKASGLRLEIISGDREAEWAFQGVTTDPVFATQPILLLEVGGGSTQFILGQGEQHHYRASFSIGTVRLMDRIPHSDPPRSDELAGCQEWLRGFLSREVQPPLTRAIRWESQLYAGEGVQLVGTGGTTSILARMEAGLASFERERIEGMRLPLERVRCHLERLWTLPLGERQKIVGLPRKRADVILTGVAIYEAVMDTLGFPELRVSTRGLRFAAVMQKPE